MKAIKNSKNFDMCSTFIYDLAIVFFFLLWDAEICKHIIHVHPSFVCISPYVVCLYLTYCSPFYGELQPILKLSIYTMHNIVITVMELITLDV